VVVLSWLWNGMTPEVSDTCMFMKTTKEVWDICKVNYSKVGDAAQIYERVRCESQVQNKGIT